MEYLYRDDSIWVAVKPPELISEQAPDKRGFADLLAEENGGYVGVVHRLDRGVGGVMVYAKTAAAAARLSACVQNRTMEKEYFAVAEGRVEPPQARLCDLLFHDRSVNKTYVVDRARKGVKEAVLSYCVEQTVESERWGSLSLLRVRLHTGRTHQIRAQLSHAGHPLLGDRKYGSSHKLPIALFSCRLSFPHPKTAQKMDFCRIPAGEVWELFSILRDVALQNDL